MCANAAALTDCTVIVSRRLALLSLKRSWRQSVPDVLK